MRDIGSTNGAHPIGWLGISGYQCSYVSIQWSYTRFSAMNNDCVLVNQHISGMEGLPSRRDGGRLIPGLVAELAGRAYVTYNSKNDVGTRA